MHLTDLVLKDHNVSILCQRSQISSASGYMCLTYLDSDAVETHLALCIESVVLYNIGPVQTKTQRPQRRIAQRSRAGARLCLTLRRCRLMFDKFRC